MSPVVLAAVAAVALGAFLAVLVAALPRRPQVGRTRLDSAADEAATPGAGTAGQASVVADRLLRRLGRQAVLADALEQAGLHRTPADVVVLTAAATLPAAAAGLLLAGPLAGLALAVAGPLVTVLVVRRRRSRRQAAFAAQLDDVLQLMASTLRAGHSVARAVDAVARDTEAPAAEEFSRVANEVRVGRDITGALQEVADRTASQDFDWVVQAIAIHREVGGNLAEVLDRVSATIRERNQLRGQVRSLSAEGRLSAVVLMVMPLVVTALMAVTSPDYLGRMTGTGGGIALLAVAAVLMVVGGLWLRVSIRVRF